MIYICIYRHGYGNTKLEAPVPVRILKLASRPWLEIECVTNQMLKRDALK